MGTNEFTDAETFKGNDIDTDGDGTVNDAETLQGNQPSELKTNVTPIYEFMNDAAATQERHDLELSINSWNYDDGFIDIIWDQSKITGTSNVSINSGTSPKITLNTNFSTPINSTTKSSSQNADYNETVTEAGKRLTQVTCDINMDFSQTGTVEVFRNGSQVASKSYDEQPGQFTIPFDVQFEKGDTLTISDPDGTGEALISASFDIYGYYNSGTITHSRKNLEFIPSKFVANPDYDSSGTGESVELEISDNSGNSVVLSESDFGSEFSVNFDDGNIQVSPQLSGDGSSSPEYYKTKVLGVQ